MFNTIGEYCVIFIAITLITFIKLLITPEGPSIFNVYRTPSSLHWLKTGVIFTVLSIQKLLRLFSSTSVEYDKLEKAQLLPPKNALDLVYLNGCNSNGDHFIATIARRSNNLADAYLFFKVSSSTLGLLEHPQTPSSTFTSDKDFHEFCVEGLKITPIAPVKKWKISYDGKMRSVTNPSKVYSVQVILRYSSDIPIFDTITDLDPLLTAKAISLEPWSLEYFKLLNKKDRVHYGQFGELSGKIVIEGKQYALNMNSVRYRTYDPNWNWAIFHRSVIHYLNAENGDRFIIGKESMPITLSK
ncbi:hypothetical protein RI129_006527 [Pyrocoelia pectoralis]|uniref:Uncharacterized protein n=1 Tax=Pyrocoelia pectoralis TaxID=417401 RepID=A0AAN7ZIK1_9COLE